jgi:hypothetical protein
MFRPSMKRTPTLLLELKLEHPCDPVSSSSSSARWMMTLFPTPLDPRTKTIATQRERWRDQDR